MKCLVTGGAGFIGSNIVINLLHAGHKVIILDNFFLGNKTNLSMVIQDVEIVKGSVENPEIINRLSRGIDYIFHHAGISSSLLIQTAKNREMSLFTNVGGFENILKAALRNNVKKIIYASSSVIYGNSLLPYKEDMEARPLNYYASTHILREKLAKYYGQKYGLETVGLRYMSVYGPNERSKRSCANVVSQFLWTITRKEHPIIYGDGAQTRDFVYVKDVSRANILAMEYDGKLIGEVFNVGTNKYVDFHTLVKTLNNILGTNINGKCINNPIKNYMKSQCADISKISKILGYEPKYNLENGILDIISSG